jgi:hypothetical protein
MMQRAGMHALLSQNAQELSPWLFVAAAGAVVLVILLLASPLLRKRNEPAGGAATASARTTTSPLAVKTSPAASGEHRALDRDIQILIKELADLTRRVNAQIAQVDERSAKLEQLVRAADERAARLRAMQGTSNGDGDASSPAPTVEMTLTSSGPADDVIDPRHVEIYTLCEQGLSTQQIAERLHRPSGEVELIIALRPRSHAMGSSRD